jgi:hypothetical protein
MSPEERLQGGGRAISPSFAGSGTPAESGTGNVNQKSFKRGDYTYCHGANRIEGTVIEVRETLIRGFAGLLQYTASSKAVVKC